MLEVMGVPEVMICVRLCLMEVLDVQEVMRCVRLCMLDVPEVMICVLLCLMEVLDVRRVLAVAVHCVCDQYSCDDLVASSCNCNGQNENTHMPNHYERVDEIVKAKWCRVNATQGQIFLLEIGAVMLNTSTEVARLRSKE